MIYLFIFLSFAFSSKCSSSDVCLHASTLHSLLSLFLSLCPVNWYHKSIRKAANPWTLFTWIKWIAFQLLLIDFLCLLGNCSLHKMIAPLYFCIVLSPLYFASLSELLLLRHLLWVSISDWVAKGDCFLGHLTVCRGEKERRDNFHLRLIHVSPVSSDATAVVTLVAALFLTSSSCWAPAVAASCKYTGLRQWHWANTQFSSSSFFLLACDLARSCGATLAESSRK